MDNVYKLIGNDPFNIKILNETLWDIKESTFNNLYNAQKELTNIRRFDFTMDNNSYMTPLECVFNLNIQFIDDSVRNLYKTSEFYKKDLSITDINSNPKLFYTTVLLFIDGILHTNFYIRPNENITHLIFKIYNKFPSTKKYIRDGFTKTEMSDMINNHSKLTILFINDYRELNFTENSNLLKRRIVNDNYALYDFDFNIDTGVKKNTDTSLCWVTYNDQLLYKYKLINSSLLNNEIFINKTDIDNLTNTYIFVKNIYILNHMTTLDISDGTEYFELPIKDMPVPIENMIIFKRVGNDILYDHDTNLTLYYPGIYKVNKNHNYDIIIYIYYTDDTTSVGSKYNNELNLYYKLSTNILDQYKDNTIPEYIKNYNPLTIEYTINDYHNSDIDHLEYKISKLDDAIFKIGDNYSIYLHKLIGYVPTYEIDVSEINNISGRLRNNNYREISDENQRVRFTEPRYLFVFRYDNPNDRFNIIVGNYQSNDIYFNSNSRNVYVYIPVRLIHNDSVITIEKYVDYNYFQDIEISDINTYYQINNTKKIQISDIFVSILDEETNQYIYVSEDDYKLYTYRNNSYDEITTNDFYNYENLYIKATDVELIDKTIYININNISFKQTLHGNNEFIINRMINNDKRNILIFKNGRLIPQKYRACLFNDNVSGPHRAKGLLTCDVDDDFTLIYNPNKYYLIYSRESLNADRFVDLSGKISKPLDLKWYDIYLNGLRLTEDNIDILSPYRMYIKNVETYRNLEIYQKNLDISDWDSDFDPVDDPYNPPPEPPFPTDDPGSDPPFPDPPVPPGPDPIPDPEPVIPLPVEFIWEIRLINPDIQQITDEIVEYFPTALDENNNFYINPDYSKYEVEGDVFLQPDKNTFYVLRKTLL